MDAQERAVDLRKRLTAVTSIESVGGTPFVMARKLPGDDFNSGMAILRLIIYGPDDVLFESTVSLPDLLFLIRALSRESEDVANLVGTFDHFKMTIGDDSHAAMMKYLDEAITYLAATRETLKDVPRRDPKTASAAQARNNSPTRVRTRRKT